MGEAILTIEAVFPSNAAAESARAELNALIAENAGDWWQDRGQADRPGRDMSATEFWPKFKARFPVSCAVLEQPDASGKVMLDCTCPDDLAGYLCWVDKDCDWVRQHGEPPPGVQVNPMGYFMVAVPRARAVPQVVGRKLAYQAETWYWAMWTPFARWLLGLGARSVSWESPQGKFNLKAEKVLATA